MTGLKRDNREMNDSQPISQRARYDRPEGFDGIPAGPRSNLAPGGQVNGRDDRWQQSGPGGRGGQKSIFERVQSGRGYQGAPGGFDPVSTSSLSLSIYCPWDYSSFPLFQVQQTIDAVTSQGLHPSQYQNHPQAQFLSPQVLAQAQAHAMAQAQAFAAMQGQQIAWNQGGGFNAPGQGFGPGSRGPFGAPPQQQRQPRGAPYLKPNPPSIPLPTKPTSEQICKHNTACTKPLCGFSHSSAVATKESGLVLSSEACEAQLTCGDSVGSFSPPFCPIPSELIQTKLGLSQIARLPSAKEHSHFLPLE